MSSRPILVWTALYVLPLAAWAGVIFWLSGRSADEASDYLGPLAGVRYVSEVFHFGEYLVFGLLAFRALAAWRQGSRVVGAALLPSRGLVLAHTAAVISMFYAVSDEYHQTFVPGRVFSVEDLAVDLAGTVTGIALAWVWAWWSGARSGGNCP